MNEQDTTAESFRVRTMRLIVGCFCSPPASACAAAPPTSRTEQRRWRRRRVSVDIQRAALPCDADSRRHGPHRRRHPHRRRRRADRERPHRTSVGTNLTAPAGARVIDAQGRWVTPGLIDVHSHLGVYPTPLRQCARRRQRDDRSDHAERLGRARGVAAGPWPSDRARRRRHDAADPAGLRQPHRRPRRDAQERRRDDGTGDEVSRAPGTA